MASHNVVHSNAFNFQSFVQNSVDPRTGQYTLGIALPALIGNELAGPQLPLRLFFSPMNDEDTGFGKGWSAIHEPHLSHDGAAGYRGISGEQFHGRRAS
ncbi:hypothetical protein [Pseudomonas putida]|uniref:Uncharacterized protein n=1 Tax=Pseudomonas putida TaxID=303 RepID=A0A7V8E9Q0_PSEPU|nr:hypothetical protein GN299_31790 [Pseudomonas putida]